MDLFFGKRGSRSATRGSLPTSRSRSAEALPRPPSPEEDFAKSPTLPRLVFAKKGELTTKQLVTIIILITSFIVILFLIFRLNLGETANAEICHNSVVLKSKTSVFSGGLDCRTNYLCISGGGDCEDISTTMKAEVDVSEKDEVFKTLAEEMESCWWQFGEGKVDYTDAGTFEQVACSVCSIVDFDEGFKEEPITYQDFYDYLRRTPKDKQSSESYLRYLYSTDSLEGFAASSGQEDYLDNSIDPSKTYVILTGRIKEGYLSGFSNLVNIIPFLGGETPSRPYPVVIMERTQENYQKIGCDEFLHKT